MTDVITFGEAMVRLSPPNFRRLEQAQSLDLQVAGAELNTAVALARLDRAAAWVSRPTANPLGRLTANPARSAGVQISIDLNYRGKLWSPSEAGRWMREFMQLCDVLITTEEDVAKVFGISGGDDAAVAQGLAATFPLKVVAITLRENPLVW